MDERGGGGQVEGGQVSHNKTEETKNTLCLCIIHTHLHVSEEGKERWVHLLKLDFLLAKTTFFNQIA